MTTRLKKEDYRNICLGVALKYTRNADGLLKFPPHTWGGKFEFPTLQHAPLEGQYLDETVWTYCVEKLGLKRAEGLSGKQIEELKKYSLQEFDRLVEMGYCHKQGFTTVYGG